MWTQLPPEKRHTHLHPIFGPCLLWPNGWVDEEPLGTEVDLDPSHIVQDGVAAPTKEAQQPPIFGPCLLWSRSPISATAELFLRYASRQTHRHRDTLIATLSTSPGRVTIQTTSIRNTYTVHIRDLYENCSLSHYTAANKFCHPHLPSEINYPGSRTHPSICPM